MMQSRIISPASIQPLALSVRTSVGHVIQVRNHAKIYPWRRVRYTKECYLDNTRTPYTDRNNINEFINHKRQRKSWQVVIPKEKDNRFNAYQWNDTYKSDPVEARETARSKLKRFYDSLMDRGAARECKPYSPPENVKEQVLDFFKSSLLASSSDEMSATSEEEILAVNLNENRQLKFNLITKCIEHFQHDLPSSSLTDIEAISDLVEYYSTPVRGINPYAELLKKEASLPANLCLIADPIRFDRETDEAFQGYNALPGLVCRVPGLRAAKKFPILNQDEFQWPDI